MRPKTFTLGPITGTGANQTAARDDAIRQAAAALTALDQSPRPFLVSWGGLFSLVYPMLTPGADGGMEWVYTAPRREGEWAPHTTDRLGYAGWSGMYADAMAARSAALAHIVTFDGPVPPETEWPVGMNLRDADRLRTLRQHQERAAQTAA